MSRPLALVTGGVRGIGRAIALALAEAGHDLAIVDLTLGAEADALAEELAAYGAANRFYACDIADLSAQDAMLATFESPLQVCPLQVCPLQVRPLQVLVNNAGIGPPVRGDMLEITPDNFDRVVGINLRGTAFFAQKIAKRMLNAGGIGRSIITITSVSAGLVSPDRPDYCVSKAGLSMWSQALALRLAAHGISVFEVRPGIIRTQMTAAVAAAYDARIADGLVPARRWGEAEDVANMVAALASGRLSFATGSIIAVDGALSVPHL